MRLPFVTENTVDVAADVNQSLLEIDGLITSRVEGLVTAPPASPADGSRWAIKTGATGLFAGKGGQIASYVGLGDFWQFYEPVECVSGNILYVSSSGNWVANEPAVNVSSISGLQAALEGKVDKSGSKVLSDNNYSTADKNKLSAIETGANKTTVVHTSGTSLTNVISQRGVGDIYLPKEKNSLDESVGSGGVLREGAYGIGVSRDTELGDLPPVNLESVGLNTLGEGSIPNYTTGSGGLMLLRGGTGMVGLFIERGTGTLYSNGLLDGEMSPNWAKSFTDLNQIDLGVDQESALLALGLGGVDLVKLKSLLGAINSVAADGTITLKKDLNVNDVFIRKE